MSDAPIQVSGDEEYAYLLSREQQECSERLARTMEQLEAFQQIALTVGSEASIETVLRMICSKTTQLMRAEKTVLFQVETHDESHPMLNAVIAERAGIVQLRFGQCIAGTVA